MEKQQKTIRIWGIVLLVLGIVTIIFTLVSGLVIGSAATEAITDEDPALVSGVVTATVILAAIFSGALPVIFGLILVTKSKYKEKAGTCFVLGIIVAVLAAISIVSSFSNLGAGIIFPIIELVAAIFVIKNAKELKSL